MLDLINNSYNVAHLADPTIAPYQVQESLQFAVSLLVLSAVGVNGGRFFAYAYYVLAVRPQFHCSGELLEISN